MKRKYIYPLLVLLATAIFYYAEEYIDRQRQIDRNNTDVKKQGFYYLPTSTTKAVVTHNYYTLSYSEKHEQPEWVAYHLKKEHIANNDFKRPFFEMDKKVQTGAADWRNYKGSGFDKGHLCPAGDRRFNYEAYTETFLTSNIAPQNHEFNAGIWNQLEQKTRYWARKYGDLYIVTGGVLTDDLKSIGYEAVSVPDFFYKIILDYNSKKPKMIAFIFPHKDTNKPLSEFIVATDQIEQRTGIDFFPSLEDDLENRLEASNSSDGWKF